MRNAVRVAWSLSIFAALSVSGIAFTSSASAAIDYTLNFEDPGLANSAYYSAITSNFNAAGAEWASKLQGSGTLDVTFIFTNSIPRATGRSETASYLKTENGINIFEQGAIAKVQRGIDVNGATTDIEIQLNPDYVANLWFDPDPTKRTAPVPNDRTDAISVFLHELGHAFVFNGWRDGITGDLPGDYASTFDALTSFDGTVVNFNGPLATAIYGGPVPVTLGNYSHIANDFPLPGSDLIPDLMNGVVFYYGTRYSLSALDLAIAADTGILLQAQAVPEPSSIIAVGIGLLGAGIMTRRRRPVPKAA